MNKSKVIVLSLSAIALSGFAFNQFYQPVPVAPLSIMSPVTSVDSSMSSSIQQDKNSHQLSNKVTIQTAELSSDIEHVNEKKTRPTTQVLLAKSTTGAHKDERPSDHQGKYSEARPHGHESYNSHSHQDAPMPPGEPKKPVIAQQPIN